MILTLLVGILASIDAALNVATKLSNAFKIFLLYSTSHLSYSVNTVKIDNLDEVRVALA